MSCAQGGHVSGWELRSARASVPLTWGIDCDESSALWKEVFASLFFVDAYNMIVKNGFGRDRSFEHGMGANKGVRVAFFALDAAVSWVATLLQLAFPVAMFVATLSYVPICY